MKNLFGFLALLLILIPACDRDATEEAFNPTDQALGSESIYAPLLSYKIDPAAVADMRSRMGNAVERPFKVKSAGIFYPVPGSAECPGQLKIVVEGSGIGSHLGTFTNHLYYCMGASDPITGKVIAANGDELYVMLVFSDSSNPEQWIQTYIITGGSGRFTDASGSYTLSGVIDYANGQYSHEGGGTITY